MIDLTTHQKYYTIASESASQKYLDPGFPEEITFGYYLNDGWKGIEISILWERQSEELVPKLECYGESFELFTICRGILDTFAIRGERLTPGGLCLLLEAHGFVDRTVREEKYEVVASGREIVLAQLANDYRKLALQQYREREEIIDGDFNSTIRSLDTHAKSIGLPVAPQEGDYHS